MDLYTSLVGLGLGGALVAAAGLVIVAIWITSRRH